jgi:hypothetical protein
MLPWPRDKHDYNPTTTTSQEGGAVPEARPTGRVSGAVIYIIIFNNGFYHIDLYDKVIMQDRHINN